MRETLGKDSATLDRILSLLAGVRRDGQGYRAKCPAHADCNPSLSVRQVNGTILLKCFAGCTTEDVCRALGIGMSELFTNRGRPKRIVAGYPYTDENGVLLYQNVRFEPKDFRLRRPNGKGGWTWNLGDVRRVLYRLPEVVAANEVLLVEGEKDADTGTSLGFAATTSGAAGSWREDFADQLRGKRVTIVADADDVGRSHAQTVARSLFSKVDSLRLIELPCAKDLSEWVEHGGTRGALLDLIGKTSDWKPEYVDGSAMLDRILEYIRRFVSLSESQARVVALWTVHTYLLAAAYATPYLAITSVEKQSGKTRLLEVLETLAANGWLTGRVTAAVLIRKIDAQQPTLLLDESDAAFGGEKDFAEALRGILNTGHRRGGRSSCCDRSASGFSCRDFSTFCPKAIAGIGKLPGTVADRSIPIRLKRAAPGECIERFRLRDVEAESNALRDQLSAWCCSVGQLLSNARPDLPESLTDRQQDGAEPLLAIADAAGGDWPEAARRSLVELCTEAQLSDDSVGKQLLADILTVFESRAVDRLSSVELVAALVEIETSPWSEWLHGKPQTPTRLAKLRKGHGIAPHSIRIGDQTPKGYTREDFRDAFLRYLRISDTRPQGATTQQTNIEEVSSGFSSRNTVPAVAGAASNICNENGPCGGVAASRLAEAVCDDGLEEDL
jgi:hypothetical protein